MSFINKIIAIIMLPVAVLVLLGKLGIFSLSLGLDTILIGAVLMILLQAISMFIQYKTNSHISFMSIITGILFISTAFGAIFSSFLPSVFQDYMPVFLGVMMLVEALYALH